MNISKDQKKRIEAIEALDFLRNHPAVSQDVTGDSIFDGFWFMMIKCCKRGKGEYIGDTGIRVYADNADAERFNDRFVQEHGENWRFPNDKKDEYDIFPLDVDVSYEEYYGEPWVFDHVEYWYETTFSVFDGDPYEKNAAYDPKNWGRYSGPQGGANSWDDMLIDCAKEVKETYGNFNHYSSFMTDAEKANNKSEDAFLRSDANERGLIPREFNPQYISIDNAIINLRWLKWFMTTEYAKKNWDFDFEKWEKCVEKLDALEPKERKDILSKYE